MNAVPGAGGLARGFAALLALFLVLASSPIRAQNSDDHDADDQMLRGVVVDASGRPAAGARVWLVAEHLWRGGVDELAAALSDAAGRFELRVPGRWFRALIGSRELGLVARGADRSLGAMAFDRRSNVSAGDAHIELASPSKTRIKVVSPDKQRITAARLSVETVICPLILNDLTEELIRANPGAERLPAGLVLKRTAVLLPAALQQEFAAVTADDGTVSLSGIAPEQIASVRIETKAFGTQRITYRPQHTADKSLDTWPAQIQLFLTGAIRGRLVSDKPDWLKGRKLHFATMPPVTEHTDITTVQGEAEVTTDNVGRFEIPALAAGIVLLSGDIDAASHSSVQRPNLTLAAEQTHEAELRVVPTVQARGEVLEAGSDKPLAGLEIAILRGYDNRVLLRTNQRGQFETELAPPGAFITPLVSRFWIPDNLANRTGTFFDVSEGKETVQAPTIKLRRAGAIRGTVVDADEKPVAGATVAASWFGYDRRNNGPGFHDVRGASDERGEFAIEGIDLQSKLRLRAGTAAAAIAEAIEMAKLPAEPIVIRIDAQSMARLHVRITDRAGAPIARPTVELWSRERVPANNAAAGPRAGAKDQGTLRRIEFADAAMLRADANGEFTTPPLPPDVEYRIELRPRGSRETVGEWVLPRRGEVCEVALAVRRTGEVRGFVRDRKGQPVEGAAVVLSGQKRAATTTDEDGAFRLNDIAGGKGFLFVQRDGFRFHALRLGSEKEDATQIVLERPDDPPAAAFRLAPRQTDPEAARTLALKLVREVLKSATEEPERMRALEVLADIDPAAALAELAANPFKEEGFDDIIRRAAAVALARQDIDAAVEVAQRISIGMFRIVALCELSDALPDSAHDRKLEVLADALVQVRGTNQPEFRLCGAGQVAERLLDLGERERGENILRGELDTARQMGTAEFAGYARGAFAEELGQIDLPEALALIKDLPDQFEFNRHHANLAHELAGRQPAEAERVLNLIKPPKQGTPQAQFDARSQYAVRVCYRMAGADLPRAERIAMSIDDLSLRGYALGVMAARLAESDPPQARKLLRRAYDTLDEALRKRGPQASRYHPAVIAGCLLPTAERLEGDRENRPLLKECIWRAVALVPLPGGNAPNAFDETEAPAAVALWLADYDAALAREIFSRIDGARGGAIHNDAYQAALAILDAAQVERHLAEIPDAESRNRARWSIAAILPLSGDDLRRKIHKTTGVWRIDVEDLE